MFFHTRTSGCCQGEGVCVWGLLLSSSQKKGGALRIVLIGMDVGFREREREKNHPNTHKRKKNTVQLIALLGNI